MKYYKTNFLNSEREIFLKDYAAPFARMRVLTKALSADLRLLVRERLLEGDSNQEVVDFIVARYGEFVRLEPNLTGSNFMLWATAPILLLIGLAMGLFFIRRQAEREKNEADELSGNEKTKLEKILNR